MEFNIRPPLSFILKPNFILPALDLCVEGEDRPLPHVPTRYPRTCGLEHCFSLLLSGLLERQADLSFIKIFYTGAWIYKN